MSRTQRRERSKKAEGAIDERVYDTAQPLPQRRLWLLVAAAALYVLWLGFLIYVASVK
jgi:hypothetical protein